MSLREDRDQQITLMDAQIIVDKSRKRHEKLARAVYEVMLEDQRDRDQLRVISARLNRIAA